jgi:hypothetical protein
MNIVKKLNKGKQTNDYIKIVLMRKNSINTVLKKIEQSSI